MREKEPLHRWRADSGYESPVAADELNIRSWHLSQFSHSPDRLWRGCRGTTPKNQRGKNRKKKPLLAYARACVFKTPIQRALNYSIFILTPVNRAIDLENARRVSSR